MKSWKWNLVVCILEFIQSNNSENITQRVLIYYQINIMTRARLGRVAPLGRPRSVQERHWMPFYESKWPNDLEGQGQCLPFSIPAVRIPRCIFGANLVNLTHIHQKLSRGQGEIPIILSQNGQNDLEGQAQWPLFSILAESIAECMFGANLGILAHFYDELSHRQVEFPRILSQNSQNDLEGQGQWPSFSIPA